MSNYFRVWQDSLLMNSPPHFANKVQKVSAIYSNPSDQKLYRTLRNEGRSAAEARDMLKLMGIEPSTSSTVPDWFWNNSKSNGEKKVEHPFFHHKRKY